MHVVQPRPIRFKRSNGRRLLEIPWTAASIAVGVAHTKIIAPGVAGIDASPRCVLPFGLSRKSVLLASQLREPANILFDVNPAHVDHRHPLASPPIWDSRARSRGDASIPLFKRHLELGKGEWLCDRHLVWRAFAGMTSRLLRPLPEAAMPRPCPA